MNHQETIKCPNCEKHTEATVEHTAPFWSYVHECECGYIITESEWEKVESIKYQMDEAINALPLRQIFGLDTEWPLSDVLSNLIETSDILLKKHQYDGHGHETLKYATDKAREILKLLINQEP